MSDMIKFINTQNHSQNPRIDRFQAQTTQIDLKFQAIRIQQEILHSHDDKTFIISPRLLTAIYNDNLLKRVWYITQRIKLLSLLFF